MYGSTKFLKLINLTGYVYPNFADANRKEVFGQTLVKLSIFIKKLFGIQKSNDNSVMEWILNFLSEIYHRDLKWAKQPYLGANSTTNTALPFSSKDHFFDI